MLDRLSLMRTRGFGFRVPFTVLHVRASIGGARHLHARTGKQLRYVAIEFSARRQPGARFDWTDRKLVERRFRLGETV